MIKRKGETWPSRRKLPFFDLVLYVPFVRFPLLVDDYEGVIRAAPSWHALPAWLNPFGHHDPSQMRVTSRVLGRFGGGVTLTAIGTHPRKAPAFPGGKRHAAGKKEKRETRRKIAKELKINKNMTLSLLA